MISFGRAKMLIRAVSRFSLTIVKLLGPGEYIVEKVGDEREGHFGLAVHDYTHSTAPNRRYADLIVQRLIKSALAGGTICYSETGVIGHCDALFRA